MMLTAEQLAVVECVSSRMAVNACPGSGKTTVLVETARQWLRDCRPENMSVLTFSRRAAMELRQRLATLGPDAEQVNVETVHAMCLKLVRRHFAAFGYSSDGLCVVSKRDRQNLIRQAMVVSGDSKAFAVKQLETFGSDPNMPATPVINAYLNILRKENAVDYTVLLRQVADSSHKPMWEDAKAACRYLLVDEAQDADHMQFWLYQSLDPIRWLMVGDERQTIYEWRGARPDMLAHQTPGEGNWDRKCLTMNFRSTEPIVRAANTFAKTIGEYPAMQASQSWGKPRPVMMFLDSEPSLVECLRGLGGSTAVLARTNFILDEWAARLNSWGVAYSQVGRNERMIDEAGTSEALAWLAWPDAPDAGLLMDRAIGSVATSTDRAMVRMKAREQGETLLNMARRLNYLAVLSFYAGWEDRSLDSKVVAAFTKVGVEGMAMEGIAGLLERYKATTPVRFWNAGGFVNWLSSLDAQDDAEPGDGIRLMTIHASKGLEFDNVVIVGLADHHLPWRGDNTDNMKEERRLFYVAMTRARSSLAMVVPSGQASPSRFLKEIGV